MKNRNYELISLIKDGKVDNFKICFIYGNERLCSAIDGIKLLEVITDMVKKLKIKYFCFNKFSGFVLTCHHILCKLKDEGHNIEIIYLSTCEKEAEPFIFRVFSKPHFDRHISIATDSLFSEDRQIECNHYLISVCDYCLHNLDKFIYFNPYMIKLYENPNEVIDYKKMEEINGITASDIRNTRIYQKVISDTEKLDKHTFFYEQV